MKRSSLVALGIMAGVFAQAGSLVAATSPGPLTCPATVAPNGNYTTTASAGGSATDWVAQYTPGAPNAPWIGQYAYVPLPRPANVTMTAPGPVGTYELRLFANDGYTLLGSCTFQVATGPTLSIDDVTVTEGNSGTTDANFTITLSPTSAGTVTVNHATADGTAAAPSDYTALASTALTFGPGEGTKTVTVQVNGDTAPEPSETFFVDLSGASGATISDSQGRGTIDTDDAAPGPLTCPGTVPPNAGYTTTVSGGTSSTDWLAQYAPGAPNSPWIGPYKYVPLPRPANVMMIAPSSVGTYELRLFANDTFTLIGSCTFQVAAGPALSIDDVTVTEGNAGTTNANFTVTLSPTSAGTVMVNYATANGTATTPSDYTALASTALTFSPGQGTRTVTVQVNGDTASEPAETFFVTLSGASGATISDAQGQGTIDNDDAPPPLLTCPGTVPPNGSYTTTVNLDGSPKDWLAQYTPGAPNSPWIGEYKYAPLPRPADVTMTAPGSPGTYELRLFNNDTFLLVATCTFQVAVAPVLSIGDVTVTEGNTGATSANFTITLQPTSAGTVTVNWATADGTAAAGVPAVSGYSNPAAVTLSNGVDPASPYPSNIVVPASSGTVTKVTVGLNGFNHTFPRDVDLLLVGPTGQRLLLLSDAGGGSPVSGINLTFDDSAAGSLSTGPITSGTFKPTNISDSEGTDTFPGPAPPGPYVSTLQAFAGLNPAGTWSLYLRDDVPAVDEGSLASGWSLTFTTSGDYTSAGGPVTFNPGEGTKTVSVPVRGDVVHEPNETFFVNLSGAAGAPILDTQGQGTIVNDDPAITCPGTVPPNGSYTAIVWTGSSPADWLAQFTPGAPNAPWIGPYKYVPLPRPANVAMTAPGTVGTYELRLFADDTSTLIGSCTFQVSTGPTLSINDVTVTEGISGTSAATFTVTLSPASSGTVTVNWAPAEGTATIGDYAFSSGVLTFSPGQGTKSVDILVNGDTTPEADETFFVNLSSASGASVFDSQGKGTIANDDGPPPPLICPATVATGGTYMATVGGGSSSLDWVAQYTPGSPNAPWIGQFQYVPLPRPQTISVTAPSQAGTYELRLFANDTFTLIGSCTFTVAGPVPPDLLSPPPGAVMDNGCNNSGGNGIIWEFAWSVVSQAEFYHLYVKGPTAAIPVIDNATLTATDYRHEANGAWIADGNRLGWKWKVRVRINGVWSAFTAERSFDAEPVNTDCP